MIAAALITVALLLCAVAALGVMVILLRRGARELREGSLPDQPDERAERRVRPGGDYGAPRGPANACGVAGQGIQHIGAIPSI